jgi:adenine-specific DNA-methyltransferase
LKSEKKVTQYAYDIDEPAEPETGHTRLLPSVEERETIEMDPTFDPQLHWSGKRRRKSIPILPLQRNEVVSESRIAQIIERVRKASQKKSSQAPLTSFFELEKALREQDRSKRVQFYTHEEKWKNKLISGDSLLVIESLLHYENLRGKVQMIYVDPPYGIKYDSNFQQRIDSTKNDEKDRADDVLTVKAFNDTWVLGIHSYLSHLQERLYLSRELLHESGSIFVQIGDAAVHLVRQVMDEVFGSKNFCAMITFRKTGWKASHLLSTISDYILWYAKDKERVKFHSLYISKLQGGSFLGQDIWIEDPQGRRRRLSPDEDIDLRKPPKGHRAFRHTSLKSGGHNPNSSVPFKYEGKTYHPGTDQHWKTTPDGLNRLAQAKRLLPLGNTLEFISYFDDFPYSVLTSVWTDTASSGFADPKLYAAQTNPKVVSRCILMTTDPGDLVFDPTCGSGTTVSCAEKWGRRWITCDTSRVAMNITRKRLLSSVFKQYLTRNGQVSSGFQYNTFNHVTLKSVARDLEPEQVELVDDPKADEEVVRVTGPFEVMTVGRYSVEDWSGYITESGKLENYIQVICRLYRKDAAIQGASGLLHAIVETEGSRIAITVGPLSGRVTAKQLCDAVEDANASGINEIHVLGWAFEANVGEIKSKLESRGKIKIQLIAIRPDTLVEGLKATTPEKLFSPYALPDIEIRPAEDGKVTVALNGVAIFNRETRGTDYMQSNSGYVSAWYLDEDYDGDCFVDCQMFFELPNKINIEKLAGSRTDKGDMGLQLTSRSFPIRTYRRIAVKVVDVFGNESTVVREI